MLHRAGYFTGFVGKFGFAVKGADGDSGYHHNEDIPMDSFDYWCGWPGQGSYKTKENEFFLQYAEKYPHVTVEASGGITIETMAEYFRQDITAASA